MAYATKEKKADGFNAINLDALPEETQKLAKAALAKQAEANTAKAAFQQSYLATPRAKAKGLTAENTAFGYKYGKPSVKIVAPRGARSDEDTGF